MHPCPGPERPFGDPQLPQHQQTGSDHQVEGGQVQPDHADCDEGNPDESPQAGALPRQIPVENDVTDPQQQQQGVTAGLLGVPQHQGRSGGREGDGHDHAIIAQHPLGQQGHGRNGQHTGRHGEQPHGEFRRIPSDRGSQGGEEIVSRRDVVARCRSRHPLGQYLLGALSGVRLVQPQWCGSQPDDPQHATKNGDHRQPRPRSFHVNTLLCIHGTHTTGRSAAPAGEDTRERI